MNDFDGDEVLRVLNKIEEHLDVIARKIKDDKLEEEEARRSRGYSMCMEQSFWIR